MLQDGYLSFQHLIYHSDDSFSLKNHSRTKYPLIWSNFWPQMTKLSQLQRFEFLVSRKKCSSRPQRNQDNSHASCFLFWIFLIFKNHQWTDVPIFFRMCCVFSLIIQWIQRKHVFFFCKVASITWICEACELHHNVLCVRTNIMMVC